MFFFFQAEDGIRDDLVTGVQTCALPICDGRTPGTRARPTCGAAESEHPNGRPAPRCANRPAAARTCSWIQPPATASPPARAHSLLLSSSILRAAPPLSHLHPSPRLVPLHTPTPP